MSSPETPRPPQEHLGLTKGEKIITGLLPVVAVGILHIIQDPAKDCCLSLLPLTELVLATCLTRIKTRE